MKNSLSLHTFFKKGSFQRVENDNNLVRSLILDNYKNIKVEVITSL